MGSGHRREALIASAVVDRASEQGGGNPICSNSLVCAPPGSDTIRCGWSGSYVLDVVCFSIKLIVELDGPQHLHPDAVLHDARRSDWLRAIVRQAQIDVDEFLAA
jgi:hypothetical protein